MAFFTSHNIRNRIALCPKYRVKGSSGILKALLFYKKLIRIKRKFIKKL
jgi:hypothetical protein